MAFKSRTELQFNVFQLILQPYAETIIKIMF